MIPAHQTEKVRKGPLDIEKRTFFPYWFTHAVSIGEYGAREIVHEAGIVHWALGHDDGGSVCTRDYARINTSSAYISPVWCEREMVHEAGIVHWVLGYVDGGSVCTRDYARANTSSAYISPV